MATEANAVKALFLSALEKAPAERAAFLDQACAGDAGLRRRLAALLRAHDESDSLLDQPAMQQLGDSGETTPPVDPDSGPPLSVEADVVRALGASPSRVQLREIDGETIASAGSAVGAIAEAGELPARYQMETEIARGGMGAVLRGRDIELGREIAVKVLLETHRERTELVQRFVDEAQIAGQLQHPGIAPVYDMGTSSGKRPYFTMKLVKGQTLAKLLAARNDAGQDRPRLLKVFEQVCQTLAYAHARGVIHRDLKPANIMVGAFGEVQVMDWGLAKVLASRVASEPGGQRPDPEALSIIATARSSSSDAESGHTQAGTALGTPAYMSPEQARGEVERVDERADVFGLGALLCETLTGKPPFPGKSGEAMRLAQKADLAGAFTRLDGCGADAELIALAKRCLGAEPDDRPRDAGKVAEGMTAYLESVETRLRQAELERANAQVKAAEERKRLRLTLALAASVLFTLVLGGGGLGWWWTQRSARVHDVETALADAHKQMDQGRWPEARAALERAAGRLGDGGPDDLRRLVGQAQTDVSLVSELEEIRLRQSAVKDGHFDNAAADPLYTETFRRYGLDVSVAEETEARLRASAVREALLAALQDWASITHDTDLRQRLHRLLDHADDDDWRRSFRALSVRRNANRLKALARREETLQQPAAILQQLGATLLAAGLADDAVVLLRRAQRRHPADFWVNHDLGKVLMVKEQAEAVRFLTVAVALRPDSPGTHLNLGLALAKQGKVDEAVVCYRQAIQLDPKYANAHNNLGTALSDQGKLDEAIASYRLAIKLDPQNSFIHNNLGNALSDQGKLDDAIASFRRAVVLDPNLAMSHSNLGSALFHQGKVVEAFVVLRKAIKLDPKCAMAHNNLGNALSDQGKLAEAIICYRQAIRLDPKNASAHYNLGNALDKLGDLDAAIAAYRQAIAIDVKLAKAHGNLGTALSKQGKLAEAVICYRQAIMLDPKDATAHFNLGAQLSEQGKVDEAIAAFGQAISLDPKDAEFHTGIGIVLYAKGKVDEAIAAFRRAVTLDPKVASAHYNLGLALSQQGKLDEAILAYRQAITLAPQEAKTHLGLGNALAKQGKVNKAIDCYRQAIQLDPKSPQAYFNLGQHLRTQGRLAESLALYRRGHALRANRPDWPYPSAQWVREGTRLVLLEKQLPDVLSGKRELASAAERIEYAGVCTLTKRHAAGVRLYAAAFTADATLADDLKAGHRYNAACSAAQAGSGKGADAAQLDDKEKTHLRMQALSWLRADLVAHRKQLENGKPADRVTVQATMQHWQKDSDLVGVRDKDALAKLAEAEREGWRKLWTDVEVLRKETQPKTAPK